MERHGKPRLVLRLRSAGPGGSSGPNRRAGRLALQVTASIGSLEAVAASSAAQSDGSVVSVQADEVSGERRVDRSGSPARSPGINDPR